MKKAASSPDAVMAAYIQKCTAQLEEQVQRLGRWPDRLQMPEPRNDIERQALEMWIEEIKGASGSAIRLESDTDVPLSTYHPYEWARSAAIVKGSETFHERVSLEAAL